MLTQERDASPQQLGGAYTSGQVESYDLTDLNAPALPADYAREVNVGGALLSRVNGPVYTIAFPYPEKIDGKPVTMQFIISGLSPVSNRTEQIENSFGDTHEMLVQRQLTPEEIEACGELVLRSHNGLFAAPITKGSAIYQYWTKSF